MRIFRKSDVLKFLNNLSYGFSFTTSLTVCYLLNGYFVGYIDVSYLARKGTSKVRHIRDTLRTIQIVTEAFARYNPLKLFLSLILFDSLISLMLLLLYLGEALRGDILVFIYTFIFLISFLAAISFLAVLLVQRVARPLPPVLRED